MSKEMSLSGETASARAEFEHCMQAGGVSLFPADTVYGLACDAADRDAVKRLLGLKGRDDGRPAAVMFFTSEALLETLPELGPRTLAVIDQLLPGPVTLILPNQGRLFPLACGPDPTRLGVRLISGPLAGAKCAVMQSSANPTGGRDARSVDEVDPAIRSGADLVLDGGTLPGKPSTVIDLHDFERTRRWLVLRKGAIKASDLRRRMESVVG